MPSGDDVPDRSSHCPGGLMRHAGTGPLKQKAPVMQSLSVSQGKAHLPYWVLHLCVRHIESFEHGSAAGPGTARAALPAGGTLGWPCGGSCCGGCCG